LIQPPRHPPATPSFPTRRSSDLTDAAGHLIRQALRQEAVDASRLRVIDGPTAYADVAVVEGDRRFVGSSLGVSRFVPDAVDLALDRKSTRLNSSHVKISYAVFCL